ncbi:hypothetical protein HDK64DRAFT_248928 [Phyllosticta capitalensis]
MSHLHSRVPPCSSVSTISTSPQLAPQHPNRSQTLDSKMRSAMWDSSSTLPILHSPNKASVEAIVFDKHYDDYDMGCDEMIGMDLYKYGDNGHTYCYHVRYTRGDETAHMSTTVSPSTPVTGNTQLSKSSIVDKTATAGQAVITNNHQRPCPPPAPRLAHAIPIPTPSPNIPPPYVCLPWTEPIHYVWESPEHQGHQKNEEDLEAQCHARVKALHHHHEQMSHQHAYPTTPRHRRARMTISSAGSLHSRSLARDTPGTTVISSVLPAKTVVKRVRFLLEYGKKE